MKSLLSLAAAVMPLTCVDAGELSLRANDTLASIALEGGALVSLAPASGGPNPFTWSLRPDEMPANNRPGAPFRGHFLCIGRWGGPTPAEIEAGIPHNGEPSMLPWSVRKTDQANMATLEVRAPLEQLTVTRTIVVANEGVGLFVEEQLTNQLPFGRFTAIVQHGTLGAPFLTPETLIDSNAGKGFNQALFAKGHPEKSYSWPAGRSDEAKSIDLRRSDADKGYVSTHVIKGDWGWVTAATPSRGWLVGYLFPTRDYPWLHLWHGIREGELWARGLEFGTTGLGDTVSPEARATHLFEGRNHLFFLDAHQTIAKRYWVFMVRIPSDFESTLAVTPSPEGLSVTVRGREGPETSHIKWTSPASPFPHPTTEK